MNEPRPTTISARPSESRSSVAKLWNTRTGSAALRTVTALESRMRFVRAAAAARMTVGAESRKSRAVVLADAEDVEPDLIRELDFVDEVAERRRRSGRTARFVAESGRGKTIDADLHARSVGGG